MKIVLALTSVQALFLAVLLFGKKKKHLSDIILGTWLTLICLHFTIYFLYNANIITDHLIINLNAGFPFLQGPFLFFYVDTLTKQKSKFSVSYLFHLVPLLIFFIYQVFFLSGYTITPHSTEVTEHIFEQNLILNLILLGSVPFYVIWSSLILKKFRHNLMNNFSSIEKINLNWLRFLIIGLGFVWFAVIVVFLVMKFSGNEIKGIGSLIFIAVTLFVYVIGYLGFKQSTVFSDVVDTLASTAFEKEEPKDESQNEDKSRKYQKSGLSENEAESFSNKLEEYMLNEKPYLNEKITLRQLSNDIGLSVNHLSQLINERYRQNFYYFINSYRVEEIKKRMQDPANEIYSLTALAFECGFGSKSSFNRIFKQLTGKTPSQFKNEKI